MIYVLIERRIAEGLETAYRNHLKNLIINVAEAEGYLGGDSLWDIQNGSHQMIVSQWRSIEDWNNWLFSPERKLVNDALRPFLLEQEKITLLAPEV